MKPSPQPHSQPKTLDELIANAEHYAAFCMANSGQATPALFFLTPEGQGLFVSDHLGDAAEKDDFANIARFVCIAHAASACVMVLEAWAKFAKPDEPFDTSEPPSEAIDRKEYVILMGESRQGNRQRYLPIIRSDNGSFFGLGEPNEPGAEMQGRFAQILTPNEADDTTRELAKVMLRVKRAGLIQTPGAPRLPGSRR